MGVLPYKDPILRAQLNPKPKDPLLETERADILPPDIRASLSRKEKIKEEVISKLKKSKENEKEEHER